MIGAVISAKMATLHECQTIYSIQDIYDLAEIISIDANNQRIANKKKAV